VVVQAADRVLAPGAVQARAGTTALAAVEDLARAAAMVMGRDLVPGWASQASAVAMREPGTLLVAAAEPSLIRTLEVSG
jgi:hypothetical protein